MVHLTRKQKELAIHALQFHRTEDLAAKCQVSRATAFRYLKTLLLTGVLAHGPGGRYVEGPEWSQHFDHIESGWDIINSESQRASLAGSSETETAPSPPRLAHRPRVEHGGQVFYFLAMPPLEFLASLKVFGRNGRGEATTWGGKVKDPDGLGTVDFYVGHKGGMSATFHLAKRPMPVPSLTQPGEVDRQIEETFQIWKRRVEAQHGLKLTPKGVPIPDGKAKEAQEPYRTGEVEWGVLGVGDIKSERVGPGVAIDGSPDEDGERRAAIATADQVKVREMAKFATGGGFEALAARLDRIEEENRETREKTLAALNRIADFLEGKPPSSQGPAPQGGGENPPGYA